MSSKNSRTKYLFANVLSFLCGSLGTKLISFFMVPLYTNILVPAEYGEIDLILSVAGVISPFLACGIHEAIMRFSLDKGADQRLVLSIGLRVFLFSSVILLLLCPVLRNIPIISNDIWFLYLYCLLNEIMTISLCYIRGKDHIKLYAFLGFISAFLTALFNIVFLVVLHWGLFGYKTSMLISPIITTIIAIVMGRLYKDFTLNAWDKRLAKDMLQYSLVLIPNAVLWWCINASDRFFVSYMCGTAANGLYAVSYKIPTLLNMVATIFMQAWQMSAIKEHEEGEKTDFSNQIYSMLMFIMTIATLSLILVNRTALNIYVGEEYQLAWTYSPPLMVAFFAGALGTFWGSFYIASKNMKRYLYSAIAGAVTNLILNLWLINVMGTMGAAIATLISYFVVLIVRAIGIQEQVNIQFANKIFISSVICITIGTVVAYLEPLLAWTLGLCIILIYIAINKESLFSLLRVVKQILKMKKTKIF